MEQLLIVYNLIFVSQERPTDSFDSKIPWLCTFCKLGPHVNRLGDLFGPYYVNVARENHQEVTKDTSNNGHSDKGMKTEALKRETWMHQGMLK